VKGEGRKGREGKGCFSSTFVGFLLGEIGGLCMNYVTQHLLVYHPLETLYDKAMDETITELP
jgi:hypothetical protein